MAEEPLHEAAETEAEGKKVEEEHPFEAPEEYKADDAEGPDVAEEPLHEAAGIDAEEKDDAETILSDDFTVISGIGVGRQNLLNEAGISTYAQLAENSPEKLLQIMGPKIKNGDGREVDQAGRRIEDG